MNNIYAYTVPEANYPAYVSLNERNGKFVLSVRSQGEMSASEIELTPTPLRDLTAQLTLRFFTGRPE